MGKILVTLLLSLMVISCAHKSLTQNQDRAVASAPIKFEQCSVYSTNNDYFNTKENVEELTTNISEGNRVKGVGYYLGYSLPKVESLPAEKTKGCPNRLSLPHKLDKELFEVYTLQNVIVKATTYCHYTSKKFSHLDKRELLCK